MGVRSKLGANAARAMQRPPEFPDENPPVEPMLGQTGGASIAKQNHAAGRAAFSGLLLHSSFFLFGAIGSESQVRACWGSGYCPMMDSIGTAVARTAPETWVPTFGRRSSVDVGHEEEKNEPAMGRCIPTSRERAVRARETRHA